MTATDCETWLRRDYLLRHGHQPDQIEEPPCTCADCPPETKPIHPANLSDFAGHLHSIGVGLVIGDEH